MSRNKNSGIEFIKYLEQQRVIPLQPTNPENPLPLLVSRFIEHLKWRGLMLSTLADYKNMILKLLPVLGQAPEKYNARLVKQVIYHFAKQSSHSELKHLRTALKAYLRFLAVENLIAPDLDCAVPVIPNWSLSSLPRYITGEECERVIASCDVNSTKGLRNKAVILLLVRLGLRALDIVNLHLEDINWSDSTLRTLGKGRREDILPLPQEVGDAILAYLEKARPHSGLGQVFLCLNAPYRPLAGSPCVSCIVAACLQQAGISDSPSRGAHLLRHSAATDLLRSGATLETVSSILRHRSLNMTTYYAKVNVAMLRKIAQPWPEVESC